MNCLRFNLKTNTRRPAILPHHCANCSRRGPRSFCNLPATALRDLHSIATTLNLDAHKVLINEGFSADHVFVICSGCVKLVASSPEGRLLLLRVVGPGDVLGLAALLPGALYRVTAITLDPCSIKSIPRDDFIRFMDNFIDASHATATAMTRDYNSAVLSARRLALSNSAAGKLASTLLDWARMDHLHDGPEHNNLPISFTMPLTHEELGSMAGISRETVTRLLTKFRREGLLDQTEQQMTLHHPNRLEAIYS